VTFSARISSTSRDSSSYGPYPMPHSDSLFALSAADKDKRTARGSASLLTSSRGDADSSILDHTEDSSRYAPT